MNYEPFDLTRAREFERSLQRIATRGIVQLFNTVRKQQQQKSSLPSKDKKENKINKGEFLDMLRNIDGDEASYKIMKKTSTDAQTTMKSVRWDALQDDLMASVKDEDDWSLVVLLVDEIKYQYDGVTWKKKLLRFLYCCYMWYNGDTRSNTDEWNRDALWNNVSFALSLTFSS